MRRRRRRWRPLYVDIVLTWRTFMICWYKRMTADGGVKGREQASRRRDEGNIFRRKKELRALLLACTCDCSVHPHSTSPLRLRPKQRFGGAIRQPARRGSVVSAPIPHRKMFSDPQNPAEKSDISDAAVRNDFVSACFFSHEEQHNQYLGNCNQIFSMMVVSSLKSRWMKCFIFGFELIW